MRGVSEFLSVNAVAWSRSTETAGPEVGSELLSLSRSTALPLSRDSSPRHVRESLLRWRKELARIRELARSGASVPSDVMATRLPTAPLPAEPPPAIELAPLATAADVVREAR